MKKLWLFALVALLPLTLGCEAEFAARSDEPGRAGDTSAGAADDAGPLGTSHGGAGAGGAPNDAGASAGAGATSGGAPSAGRASGGAGTAGAPSAGAPAAGSPTGDAGASGDCTAPYAPELQASLDESLPESVSLLADFRYCKDNKCTEATSDTGSCPLAWSDVSVASDGRTATATVDVSCYPAVRETTPSGSSAECPLIVTGHGTVSFTATSSVDDGILRWDVSHVADVQWSFSGTCADVAASGLQSEASSVATTNLDASLKPLSLAAPCGG